MQATVIRTSTTHDHRWMVQTKLMNLFYLLSMSVPTVILLIAALKLHQRKKLPSLMLTGIILTPVFFLPQLMLSLVGMERIQESLLARFPVANDPEASSMSQLSIDGVTVGPVAMLVNQLSYSLPGIPALILGLGVLRHARQQVRLHQENLFNQAA